MQRATPTLATTRRLVGPLLARMAIGAAAIVCIALALDPLAGSALTHGALFDFDVSRDAWLHEHPVSWFTTVMQALSALHGTVGILALTTIACVALATRGLQAWALRMALVVPAGMLLNVAVKHVVERPRPTFDGLPASLSTWSFPSGHTAESTVFYGLLVACVFASRRDTGARVLVVVAALSMVVAVAASRLYLGAHYFSDVVAAMLEGLCWLVICLAPPPRAPAEPAGSREVPIGDARASTRTTGRLVGDGTVGRTP